MVGRPSRDGHANRGFGRLKISLRSGRLVSARRSSQSQYSRVPRENREMDGNRFSMDSSVFIFASPSKHFQCVSCARIGNTLSPRRQWNEVHYDTPRPQHAWYLVHGGSCESRSSVHFNKMTRTQRLNLDMMLIPKGFALRGSPLACASN